MFWDVDIEKIAQGFGRNRFGIGNVGVRFHAGSIVTAAMVKQEIRSIATRARHQESNLTSLCVLLLLVGWLVGCCAMIVRVHDDS